MPSRPFPRRHCWRHRPPVFDQLLAILDSATSASLRAAVMILDDHHIRHLIPEASVVPPG